VAEALREPVDFLGREPADGGQIGPLVHVRLHRGQVEEDGCSAAAGPPLQGSRDEIAEAADLDDVLGGEEPVIAGQVHPPAHGDRLPQQSGTDLTGGRRRDWCGEEQPDVRSQSRAGHLQRGRSIDRAGRLQVGQRVEHGRGAVEVGGQPGAAVAVQE
jgi:hypothetical protein